MSNHQSMTFARIGTLSRVTVRVGPRGADGTNGTTTWRPLITSLTGGGATSLDGIVTAGVAVRELAMIYVASQLQYWLLLAGTAATDEAEGIVRPLDYNASTNAKNWIQVG